MPNETARPRFAKGGFFFRRGEIFTAWVFLKFVCFAFNQPNNSAIIELLLPKMIK
jgi:hypothetical protein